MEKKLIKALLYSFILGLMVAILYYPDTQKLFTGNGSYSVRELPLREYLFKIVRFSIKIALVTVLITWVLELKKEREVDSMRSTKGLIKSFLIAFVAGAGIALITAIIFR